MSEKMNYHNGYYFFIKKDNMARRIVSMNRPEVVVPNTEPPKKPKPVSPNATQRLAKDKRTYAEEMALALDMAKIANHDRNVNRAAEVDGWLNYGLEVAIARRSHAPMPPRPDRKFA